jgi:hypothetical protein
VEFGVDEAADWCLRSTLYVRYRTLIAVPGEEGGDNSLKRDWGNNAEDDAYKKKLNWLL